MRHRRLVWQLFPALLAAALVPLVAATLFAAHALREFHLQQVTVDLEQRAQLLELELGNLLTRPEEVQLNALVRRLGQVANARITLIAADGRVLADSIADWETMENHGNRPEVRAALAGRTGSSLRFSRTLGRNLLYVAVPLHLPDGRVDIVRTAMPLTALEQSLDQIRARLAWFGLLVAALAALLSLVLARRLAQPIEVLRRMAVDFAHGHLSRRLPKVEPEELGALAEAMNTMAAELDARMSTVLQQRNELEAVLAGMVEGVVALDAQQRVLRINGAAATLFGLRPEQVTGHTVHEVLRNVPLQRLLDRALARGDVVEDEIVLRDGEDIVLQATATPLRDGDGRVIGLLAVLNNLTRLRRLETVRRDFVANVSHELKTPITSIKGFVETLLDGEHDPADVRRFLEVIARQADRLHAIIEDLLTLSRIEQDSERQAVPLELAPVQPVLQAAVQSCEHAAAEKGIELRLLAAAGSWRINAALLEEAVVNLIDNAVKYSERGTAVELTAAEQDDELVITVRDHGAGIAEEHLPRLFERFYRVDKARSRKQGGTGLGLAIVKHIVQAHGGYVTVESAPGRGSTFRLHLPTPA